MHRRYGCTGARNFKSLLYRTCNLQLHIHLGNKINFHGCMFDILYELCLNQPWSTHLDNDNCQEGGRMKYSRIDGIL